MAEVNLRTGQVIVPFGIGQIIPNEEGLSLMLGGLNLWEESIRARENAGGTVDLEEFEIKNRRLTRLLRVKKLMTPFPYIKKGNTNTHLSLPAVVFPLWHYCTFCGMMHKMGPKDINRHCQEPTCRGRKNKMIPVRFIAACDHGHIEDFPFNEWVHREKSCNSPKLKFKTGGGSGNLAGIWIQCQSCNSQENLGGILEVRRNDNGEIISSALDTHLNCRCLGHKPWTGSTESEAQGCEGDNHLQVIISGGSNVHYSSVTSALILPEVNLAKEIKTLVKPMPLELLEQVWKMGESQLRNQLEIVRTSFEDKISLKDLVLKIDKYFKGEEEEEEDYSEVLVRFEEYEFFRNENFYPELRTKIQEISTPETFYHLLKKVVLVEKLSETKVYTGFTRLNSTNMMSLEERKKFLTANEHSTEWLPAYQHYGEGIFLEFDLDFLQRFLESSGSHPRITDYHNAQFNRSHLYSPRDLDGVFILIHTLSHLLIRRLCFRCGYGSSSVKEKIYYSTKKETRMAGLLLYTASGDAEGSLGGLVSQGKLENFAEIFHEALQEASWCSADPVCSDLGEEGQGPNNVNGAACHNCAILPETSCEEYNSLLDRSIIKEFMGYSEKMASETIEDLKA